MTDKISIASQIEIESRIFTMRGFQVMLDYDLATIYEVETKRLNEQVKRNKKRFPDSFMFQLSQIEWNNLQSQFATTSNSENLQSQIATAKRRTLPYVFTEQGVSMLSAVLNSDQAIQVSINIMLAFVNMRKVIQQNALIFQKLDKLENKQVETDQKFEQIFKALEQKIPKPDKGIFFEGQIFDAYILVAELIKKADKSLILIDNYIDETVLTILSKRKQNVTATIYTKQISKQLQLDLTKHNEQYPKIDIKILAESHDRFLIIDQKELYHIGASLKDLGKKWFAFSQMDSLTKQVLTKLP